MSIVLFYVTSFGSYPRFGGTYPLTLQGATETIGFSETLVITYKATLRHNHEHHS
jgi:hypothetical protein